MLGSAFGVVELGVAELVVLDLGAFELVLVKLVSFELGFLAFDSDSVRFLSHTTAAHMARIVTVTDTISVVANNVSILGDQSYSIELNDLTCPFPNIVCGVHLCTFDRGRIFLVLLKLVDWQSE